MKTKWTPEIPRPILTGDTFKTFLAEWINEEYTEELLGIGELVKDTLLYHSILDEWNGDNEETAEALIRYHGWSFEEATEFVEKDLDWAINKREKQLAIDWTKANGYSLPFPVGSRVNIKTAKGEQKGIIQPDPENYYFPQGEVCVLTDEQVAENQRNQAKGNPQRMGGYVKKWEDLEFIGE